ncbi:MAG: L,D-transpeptidase [Propionibacteriales bacterium]|nr:L,D-transpeptidase [Propionibacteriales bacterium]
MSATDARDDTDTTALDAAASDDEQAPATGLADADGSTRIAASTESTSLPARSGTGRRIVFSESRQRVWLVDGDNDVVRTYLVSGSIEDNLDPGTYEVYSRSRNAVGIDDSGTMEYFARFTQGTQGAAIGFHTIPVDDGAPVQTLKQLGTPLSHGCIRQKRSDAIALWDFAPTGTTVVVTA